MQPRFWLMLLSPFCFWQPMTHGDEAAEQLILSTYKLANDASTATGFVVCRQSDEGDRECWVITARHVLERMQGDSCLLVSRRLRDDQMYQRDELPIPIRDRGRPRWLNHPQRDLAALPLPGGLKVNSLPLDSLATPETVQQIRVGDSVRLAVFPERTEANRAGFAVLRSGSIASFPLVPIDQHFTFLVDTTAWGGDSGGPVIHATKRSPSGGPLVVGVIRGMRQLTDTTRESRFVERRTVYPLGLSEVVQAALIWEMIPPSPDD